MHPQYFKIEFFVPASHKKVCCEALFSAGCGRLGLYEHVQAESIVSGNWRPLAGAKPYEGSVGELSQALEFKVEILCPEDCLEKSVSELMKVHPYETPAVYVIPLWSMPARSPL
jgi:hypothetical protein